jgi:hypothetical protein
MLDMWPNSRFPQKLCWEAVDDTNIRRRVCKIHIVFHERKLYGIIFEYEGGALQRSAGHVDGERQTMTLEEAEIPIRMDLKIWGDEHAIIVSTS